MKNYKEMADSVFGRSNEIIKNNRIRKRKIMKIITVSTMSCCCVAVLLVVGVLKNEQGGFFINLPNHTESEKNPPVSESQNGNSSYENTFPIKLFMPSSQDPNADSFAEDEAAHVDVVLNNSIVYRQLLPEEYEEYGFAEELEQTDFGERIGEVAEIYHDKENSAVVGSQDPVLKGCQAYYYAHTNKAAIIVKNEENNIAEKTSDTVKAVNLAEGFNQWIYSEMTYDANGNPTKIIEPENVTITFIQSAKSSNVNTSVNLGTSLYTYQLLGQVNGSNNMADYTLSGYATEYLALLEHASKAQDQSLLYRIFP